jgi:hypothetical protein
MADGKPNYAQINRKVWNTHQFRSLSKEARELFFYLTTCPHGNMLGIYVLRAGYALDDLQLGTDRELFFKPLRELLDKQLFKYDPDTEIILDLEQLQKHPPENPNQIKAAIKIINSLPTTPLFCDLKQIAKQLTKEFVKPLVEHLDKRSGKPVTETASVSVSVSVSVPVSEAEKAGREISRPVENSASAPEAPPVKNAFLKEMEKDFSAVMTKLKSKYDYQQMLEIENWIKSNYRGRHPQALIHTLNALTKTPDRVRDIAGYLDKVIAVENQNYNYSDFQKTADEFKKPGLFSIGDIFKGIKLHYGVT